MTITALYDLINLKNLNKVNFCPDKGISKKKGKKEKTHEKMQTERKKQQRAKLANK